MASDTLSFARETFPEIAQESDRDVTLFMGDTFSDLLEADSKFAEEYAGYKKSADYTPPSSKEPQGFLPNLGEGFYKGVRYDLGSSFAGLGEAAVGLVSDSGGQWFSELAAGFENSGAEFAERNNLDLDSWGAAIGGGAASLIPIAATGGGTGLLLRGATALNAANKARVATSAVYGMVGAQSFGGSFREAKQNYMSRGLSEEEAVKSAYLPALGSATFEVGATILGGKVAKKLGIDDIERSATSWLASKEAKQALGGMADAVKSGNAKLAGKYADTAISVTAKQPKALARIGLSGLTEGGEEAGAAIGDSIIAVMSHNPDLTLEQAATGVWKNFVVGGLLGGSLAGLKALTGTPVNELGALSDKEVADVETLRASGSEKTASAVESKTRAKRAASDVLPDDGDDVNSASTPQPQPEVSPIQQRKAKIEGQSSPDSEADTQSNAVDQSDIDIVAKFLGIPASEFNASDWNPVLKSPEFIRKLRYASESKQIEWAENESQLTAAQRKMANDILRSIDRPPSQAVNFDPNARLDTPVTVDNRPASQSVQFNPNQRIRTELAGIASDADSDVSTQVDPDQNLNIVDMARMSSSEINPIAEAALGGTELSPTNRTAVDRMLNRKAELLGQLFADEPARARGVPLDTEAETDVINEITDIDTSLASILGVSAPAAVTRAEARQFVESVDQKLQSAKPEIETEPAPVVESAQLDVSGDSVEVIGAVDEGMQKSLRSALSKAKKRLGSLVNLKRIVATELSGGAGAASAARRGRRADLETILIDPARLAERMKRGNFDLSKVLEEELLHNLDGKAIRHLYNQKRKRGELSSEVSFRQFFEDHHQQIADQMTGDEQAAARKFYGEDFRDPVHMAQEFIRQLLQKRHTKVITEEAMGNPLIRAIIRAIHYAYGKVKVTKGLLKTHLDNASNLLVEIQKDPITVEQEAPATVSQPTPEATTIEDVGKDDELDVEESEDADDFTEVIPYVAPTSEEQQAAQDKAVASFAINKIHELERRQGKAKWGQAENAGVDTYIKDFLPQYEAGESNWSESFAALVQKLRDPRDVAATQQRVGRDDEGRPVYPVMTKEALSAVRTMSVNKLIDGIRKDTGPERSTANNVSLDYEDESGVTLAEKVADERDLGDYTGRGAKFRKLFISKLKLLGLSKFEGYVFLQSLENDHAKGQDLVPFISGERFPDRKINNKTVSDAYSKAWNKLPRLLENDPQAVAALEDYIPASASDPRRKLINDILDLIPDPAKKVFETVSRKLRAVIVDPLKEVKVAGGKRTINFTPERIKKDGYINKTLRVASQRARDLENAIKAEYPKGVTDDQRAFINQHLNGVKELAPLPQKVADAVADMRTQIDALSNYMINKGMVDGTLKAKLQSNLGMYLARSYAIFDNKNYQPSSEAESAAVNYIAKQLLQQDDTLSAIQATDRARVIVSQILADLKDKNARDSYNKGKLGSKDLSLFRKKDEDLAQEIRALMGEYQDPVVNYLRTVSRMAHFVGNQNFLSDLLKKGDGTVFWEEGDPNSPENTVRIEGGESYSPLSKGKKPQQEEGQPKKPAPKGYRTTPEMKRLLTEYEQASSASKDGLWSVLVRINATIKAFKTIGSVMTTMRNYISQPFHLIHNGYWNAAGWKDAAVKASQSIIADDSGTDRELQDYYNEGVQLGLAGEDMTTAELKKTLKIYGSVINESNSLFEWMNKGQAKMMKDLALKGKDKAILFYQSADTIGKFVAWEMEQAKLRKLPTYAGSSPKEIRAEAARRVRMTMPTYSELPPELQHWRRQPLVGDFMSFAYEAMRTQINNVKLIKDEWKNNTPESKSYARQRLLGMMTVTAGYSALFKALSSMWGDVDEEEQKEVRSLMAPWEKNSTFLFSRSKEGELNYVNVSYDNPYSATTDAIMSLMPVLGIGDRPAGGAGEQAESIIKQIIDPFVGESLMANALIDISRNSDDFGNNVWEEDQSGGEQAASILGHLLKAASLGTFDRAYNRWLPAYKGETLRSGEKPTLKREMISEAIGLRLRTLDYKDKLGKQSYNNNDRLQVANRIFTRLAGGEGTVSNSDLLISYRSANNARRRVFADIKRQVNAARAGGLSDKEIKTALTQYMTDKDAKAVMRGQFVPYKVSSQLKKKAKGADRKLPLTDLTQIYREFAREDLEN